MRKGRRASVDFLDPRGAPVQRPYMGGAPSLKMVAHYDDCNGMFAVDLWEEGKGFILDLTHEYNYELDPERREALVPALSRNERDHFLDACYSIVSCSAPFFAQSDPAGRIMSQTAASASS